jgi:hypothetical protein
LVAIGLQFSNSVDVSGIATAVAAVATVGLALTTAFLARGTKRAAIATEDEASTTRGQSEATVRQAEATTEQVALSRRQLEEGHRPLVVPQLMDGDPRFGPAGTPHRGLVPIPVRNIGLGPALDVQIAFSSPPHIAPQPIRTGLQGRVPGMAVGEAATVAMRTSLAVEAPDFVVELAYTGVGGASYFTRARWDSRECAYADVSTTCLDGREALDHFHPPGPLL